MNALRIFSAAAAIILAVTSCHAQQYRFEQLHKQAPKVPAHMVFAGQSVSFDRPDMYERMDRELISFTYMHSNSLLMLKRAPSVFAVVEPILEAEGVPEDFKYMMAIESNLDPKAVSSAGAAGLWQFGKSTAPRYGLEVGTEVDERYNLEKATVAACRFLKASYEKFGDWFTVAAGYNTGESGIVRRVSEQKQTSAFDLWLVEETSRYLFRMMAAKMFFENPEAFGFSVADEDCYKAVGIKEVVPVKGPIPSLVDFALDHGVSYAQLKNANLWLRDSKLTNKGGKTYNVVIPDFDAYFTEKR